MMKKRKMLYQFLVLLAIVSFARGDRFCLRGVNPNDPYLSEIDMNLPHDVAEQLIEKFPKSCHGECPCDGTIEFNVKPTNPAGRTIEFRADATGDTEWQCLTADTTVLNTDMWMTDAYPELNEDNVHHAVLYGLYPGSNAEEFSCCQFQVDNGLYGRTGEAGGQNNWPSCYDSSQGYSTDDVLDGTCCYPCREYQDSHANGRHYQTPDGMIKNGTVGGDAVLDCYDVGFIRGPIPFAAMTTMVLGWQRGNPDLHTREYDVRDPTAKSTHHANKQVSRGFPIGAQEGFSRFLLQMHYHLSDHNPNVQIKCPDGTFISAHHSGDCTNHGGNEGAVYAMVGDTSGVRFMLTEDRPRINLGYILAGLYPSMWLYIPSGKPLHTMQTEFVYNSRGCSPSFDNGQTFYDGKAAFDNLAMQLGYQNLEDFEEMYIVSSAIHFHTHATNGTVFLRSPEGEKRYYDEYVNPVLYRHGPTPAAHVMSERVPFRRGDDFIARVDFTTACDDADIDQAVVGGTRTQSEMMVLYPVYYPAPDSHSGIHFVSPCETCFDVNRNTGDCRRPPALSCYNATIMEEQRGLQSKFAYTENDHRWPAGWGPLSGTPTPDHGKDIYRFIFPYPFSAQGFCPTGCFGSAYPQGNVDTDAASNPMAQKSNQAVGPPPLPYVCNALKQFQPNVYGGLDCNSPPFDKTLDDWIYEECATLNEIDMDALNAILNEYAATPDDEFYHITTLNPQTGKKEFDEDKCPSHYADGDPSTTPFVV